MDLKSAFAEKIKKAKQLKITIENSVERGDFDSAEMEIKVYKELFPDDVDVVATESAILFAKGEIDASEKHIQNGLKKNAYNFDLNYNLGFIYRTNKMYQEATDAFLIAKMVASNDEEKKIVADELKEIEQNDVNIDFSKEKEVNYKLFPLKTIDSTWIGKTLFKSKNGEGYIPLYYNEPLMSPPINLWNIYKTESLKGKKYRAGQILIENSIDTAIPLAVIDNETTLSVSTNKNKYSFDSFVPNRYHYIHTKNNIKISGNRNFIVGNPIALKQKKNHDVKLSLCLFIDGLSQEFIDKHTLVELMPNTYSFFNKGTIFKNCYSNAEWTMASLPSVFTGKYQTNHKIYHPEFLHSISEENMTIGEYFKNDDYLTFQACGNWRKTPTYGYVKGFDRMIYQSATLGSTAEEIISSFFEQLRAFSERDQFAWLTFFELHNVDDNIMPQISNQIINSIDSFISKEKKKKSVEGDYDKKKIEKYINEIKRIDYYLGLIYNFIEKNYRNDEILITLLSDHGQSYIDKESYILRNSRTKVPLMIRGRAIPAIISDELVQNIDILPIILKKCSIDFDAEQLDGLIPKAMDGERGNEYVYSESIYPGKTYKAILRDVEHNLIFESEGLVENDGRFYLGNFSIKLERKDTKDDETNQFPEKISKYFDIIIAHIGSFLKI